MWVIYVFITVLAIIDRFKTNVWPRQNFSIGDASAGSDRLEGFNPGPWSVVIYDVMSRISGRFSICCFNFMLISRYADLVELCPVRVIPFVHFCLVTFTIVLSQKSHNFLFYFKKATHTGTTDCKLVDQSPHTRLQHSSSLLEWNSPRGNDDRSCLIHPSTVHHPWVEGEGCTWHLRMAPL